MPCSSSAALRAGGGEIAWVGDCRAYFFDGAGVRQLTADQTMAAAVREAGVAAAPRWEHVVTQSVRSAAATTAGVVPVPAGWGRLALVTDGVHRELSPAEIAAVLAHGHDPATAARELTDLALLAGGGDNASATVVEVPLVPCAARPAHRHRPGVPRGGRGRDGRGSRRARLTASLRFHDGESPFPRRRVVASSTTASPVSATARLRSRDGESSRVSEIGDVSMAPGAGTEPTRRAVRAMRGGVDQAERRCWGIRRWTGRWARGVESVVRWKCPRRERLQR